MAKKEASAAKAIMKNVKKQEADLVKGIRAYYSGAEAAKAGVSSMKVKRLK